MPVYALLIANADGRLGPRLTQTSVDCAEVMATPRNDTLQRPFCDASTVFARRVPEGYSYMAGGFDISNLAGTLSGQVGRLVVDRTGLQGLYDFDLEFTPASAAAAGRNDLPQFAVSIFAAMEEQLGLKLVSAIAPVATLIVDRIARPDAN